MVTITKHNSSGSFVWWPRALKYFFMSRRIHEFSHLFLIVGSETVSSLLWNLAESHVPFIQCLARRQSKVVVFFVLQIRLCNFLTNDSVITRKRGEINKTKIKEQFNKMAEVIIDKREKFWRAKSILLLASFSSYITLCSLSCNVIFDLTKIVLPLLSLCDISYLPEGCTTEDRKPEKLVVFIFHC